MIDFYTLAFACTPNVAVETISAIVQIESSYNPYAIGVVGGYLERQPKTKEEAIATAQMLYQHNYNFSMGLAQINLHNLPRYEISIEEAFDPCINLKVGGKILEDCYLRAAKTTGEQEALRKAFSCYYSGNFIRGFKPDSPNTLSYVDKVVNIALSERTTVPKVKAHNSSSEENNNIAPATINVINTSGKMPTRTDRDKARKSNRTSSVVKPTEHDDNDSVLVTPSYSDDTNVHVF